MKILENKSLFRILFWVWIIFIIILTAIPIPWLSNAKLKTSSGFELRFDYFAHSGLLFILFAFYYFWKLHLTKKINNKHFIIFIIGSLILCFLDEYAQVYVPSRTYNIVDFYYNTFGIILGFVAYLALRKFWFKNH
ncbi:MAG: VanZ family protein [Saprospiraceae bacterium]|nr:VanZ family protein [Saprospiraceae bacterium]